MGLFCKGLHCAGCGKGIPAGIVVVLVLIAVAGGKIFGGMADAIRTALIYFAITVPIAAAFTAIVIAKIFRSGNVLGMKWDGKTMAETKAQAEITESRYAVPQWPNRPAIESIQQRPPWLMGVPNEAPHEYADTVT